MASQNIKGFKICDSSRKKLYGVACKSLDELILKGSKKLQIAPKGLLAYLQDGTIIDNEYFATLPQQTVVILATKGSNIKTNADLIYDALKMINIDILRTGQAVNDFFQHDIKEKIRALFSLVKAQKECEDEEDFSSWIAGIDTSYRTKEAFMESKCKDRIRGYLQKTMTNLKASEEYLNGNVSIIDNLINELKTALTKRQYECFYFNRLSGTDKALCDSKGIFTCGGSWDQDRCNHKNGEGHQINPYFNREQRIIFSTWNLDHRIELSRSIIPTILKTCSLIQDKQNKFKINSAYIYSLLFTKENLKLVHIVCHDKSAHYDAVCEPTKMLLMMRNGIMQEIPGLAAA